MVGTKGQVLTKQSKTDGDANWEDIEANEVFVGNEEEAPSSAKIIIEDEDFEEGSTLSKSEVYVGAEEPTTGEKVWFNKDENSIFVRNSNGVYEEFIKKSEEVYSTEEQRIGTWIDGKPLYRKIVNAQFGTVVQGTETTVEVNLKNVDFILVDKYWLDRKTASSVINQGYVTDALYLGYTSFSNSNTTLRFRTKQSWVSNTAIYAIIEYTKTTD